MYDETKTGYRCPGANGNPPIVVNPTAVPVSVATTWNPLDEEPFPPLFLANIDGEPVEAQLAFTKPPGEFGKLFGNKKLVFEGKNPAGGIAATQTLRSYFYRIVLKPCQNQGKQRIVNGRPIRTSCPKIRLKDFKKLFKD